MELAHYYVINKTFTTLLRQKTHCVKKQVLMRAYLYML